MCIVGVLPPTLHRPGFPARDRDQGQANRWHSEEWPTTHQLSETGKDLEDPHYRDGHAWRINRGWIYTAGQYTVEDLLEGERGSLRDWKHTSLPIITERSASGCVTTWSLAPYLSRTRDTRIRLALDSGPRANLTRICDRDGSAKTGSRSNNRPFVHDLGVMYASPSTQK